MQRAAFSPVELSIKPTGSYANCTTSSTSSAAAYNLSDSTLSCAFMMILGM